jgi:hypothetical protein
MYSCRRTPTFRRNKLPPTSRFKCDNSTLQMEAACSLKTPISVYKIARCHNPKDYNPKVLICTPYIFLITCIKLAWILWRLKLACFFWPLIPSTVRQILVYATVTPNIPTGFSRFYILFNTSQRPSETPWNTTRLPVGRYVWDNLLGVMRPPVRDVLQCPEADDISFRASALTNVKM